MELLVVKTAFVSFLFATHYLLKYCMALANAQHLAHIEAKIKSYAWGKGYKNNT